MNDETKITILGIDADGVTEPSDDLFFATSLYTVPIKLSRAPSYEWCEFFYAAWNKPNIITMHRPGMVRVNDDKIYLGETTIDDIDSYKETLLNCVEVANTHEKNRLERNRAQESARQDAKKKHEEYVKSRAKEIKF